MPGQSGYDEKDLLLKAAEGDEFAFERLFLHWHQLLASFIFRITASSELAEDIIQDVFLKIWMSRETLKDIENFKPYLMVISRNHALNVLRTAMREKKRLDKWGKENPLTVDPETERIKAMQLTLVDEAINQLPPQQKRVYLLHRHEKFTYKQIAAKLGISRETVKDHIRLAVASVSKYIRSRLLQIVFVILWIKIF